MNILPQANPLLLAPTARAKAASTADYRRHLGAGVEARRPEGIDSIARYAELGEQRLVVPLPALGARSPIEGIEKLGEALAKLR